RSNGRRCRMTIPSFLPLSTRFRRSHPPDHGSKSGPVDVLQHLLEGADELDIVAQVAEKVPNTEQRTWIGETGQRERLEFASSVVLDGDRPAMHVVAAQVPKP